MKTLRNTGFMILLTLMAASTHAQNRQAARRLLFDGYPSTMSCSITQLGSLFTAAKGQDVNLPLAGEFAIAGRVTNNVIKYSNLQTVVILLPEFENTLCSISKQTDKNNNVTYTGKIINPLYADGFQLTRNSAGNYQLVKIDVQKILVNCNQ